MTQKQKRALSPTSASRCVSPPNVKRRATPGNPHTIVQDQDETNRPDRIRIYSWNVNGINPFLQPPLTFSGKVENPLRGFLRRHNWPQFLCLQEVKISNNDDVTQRRLQHAANTPSQSPEPTYEVHFSLPRDKWNATGFGGRVHGVATLIREDYVKQIAYTSKPEWDLEGRVLIHRLHHGLAVVNGYWVNGTNNPYRDPVDGSITGTRHDHKLRFHQRMLEECQKLIEKKAQIILLGDMNVARSSIDGHPNLRVSPMQYVKNRADFNEKFFTSRDGLEAIDVFRELHGQKKKYTYHPRGCGWGQSCDRVDLIIVTRKLFEANAVVATDICDNPQDRGHSDHVPLWVDVDLNKLEANQIDRKSTA